MARKRSGEDVKANNKIVIKNKNYISYI